MNFINSIEFAQQLDQQDKLSNYRNLFYFPIINNKPAIYFTGNSLGLQPKKTQDYILDELEDWATYGVEGHFHARHPWYSYHELFTEKLARLVGAKNEEVVCMNHLTVNLHLLFVSFYRPTPQRFKIITEAKAFPSDQYAIETQIQFHNLTVEDALIEVAPRPGEYLIREEDILQAIETHKNQLALVFFGGVNYYTGQVFNMEKITQAAHAAGAIAGFDLAHAAGNIKLELNKWGVDFAAWCSYKYLNSGPGGVSGVYINEKHAKNTQLVRFGGWWGHDKNVRFKMEKGFKPMPTAEGWQLSNAPVLSMAAHLASLDIFDEVGMDALVEKSRLLTDYLEFIINDTLKQINQTNIHLEIITPKQHEQRGCQLSIVVTGKGRELFEDLLKHGVITDWREPDVIRLAPVPLYNSFQEMFTFGQILKHLLLK
jgi:kynureninase